MDSFGASAPAKDLYKHFGITSKAIIERVEDVLEQQKS
jgi:transketolase